MNINEIYERASVSNVASFIQYGCDCHMPNDGRTYEERIKDAEKKIFDFIEKNFIASEIQENVVDDFFVQIEECKNVYMEIGFAMGMKLGSEIHNTK